MAEKLTRDGSRADELEPPGAEAYLPEYVDRLTGDTTASVHFGEFTDTGTPGPDGWAVDDGEVSRVGGTGGLQLLKDTTDTFQRGVYYYLDDVRNDGSFLASIFLATFFGEAFKASYTVGSDFTGVLGGVIHGPTQKALIFMLRGDYIAAPQPSFPPCDFEAGYTKLYLDICFPAQDGAGDRTVIETLEFYPVIVPMDMGGGTILCYGFPACLLSIGVRWDATEGEVEVSLLGGHLNYSGTYGGGMEESLRATIDIDDIDEVLPGMTFGGLDWSEPFQKVGVFAGLDAKDEDTQMLIFSCGVGSLVKKRMTEGIPTAGTTYSEKHACMVEFRSRIDEPEDLEEVSRSLSFPMPYTLLSQDFEESEAGESYQMLVDSNLGLHFHADYATAGYWGELFPAPVFREPFPGKGEWGIAVTYPRLTVSLKLGEFLHPRSANTGWGIAFPITVLEGDTAVPGYEPPTKTIEVYLFDDFEEKYLAVYTPDPAAPSRGREANFTRLEGTWGENSTLELTIVVHPIAYQGRPAPPSSYAVSFYDEDWTLLGTVNLYDPEGWPAGTLGPFPPVLDDEVFPVADGDFIGIGRLLDPQEISPTVSAETFVGDMYLSHWRCLPSCLAYLPDPMARTFKSPEDMGWQAIFFGGTYSFNAEDGVEIEDTGYSSGPFGEGFYGFMYKGWSGGGGGGGVRSTMTGRFKINSWTDTIGTPNAVNTPISAGHFISDGLTVAYTAFLDTGTKKYVFIPGADLDASVSDVIAQNTNGRAISAEVDFTEFHSYTLCRLEEFGILLYIDDAHDPIISVQESDLPEPGELPLIDEGYAPSKFRGIGSWDPTRAAVLQALEWAYGSSRGYDMALATSASEEELGLIEGNLAIRFFSMADEGGGPGPIPGP